jgi:hypothetical protein
MKPSDSKFTFLVDRHLDGLSTESEAAELSFWLESDRSLRQHYLDLAKIHASLATQETLWSDPLPGTRRPPLRSISASGGTWWLTLLGIIAILAMGIGYWLWQEHSVPTNPEVPFVADGPLSFPQRDQTYAAVLKNSLGVKWAMENPPKADSMLAPGTLRWTEGLLLVEFLSASSMLIEGPGELEILSGQEVILHRGVATATVSPSARKFRLRGPGFAVEELARVTGIAISGNAPPEIHVLDGAARIPNHALVQAVRAVQWKDNVWVPCPANAARFLTPEKLAERESAMALRQIETWRESAALLSADPACLVHFIFDDESPWARTVANRTIESKSDAATLTGAERTIGRWPGKAGVEFRGLGDRMGFRVPGSHEALTLLAWLRVDALPNDYNALILPSHYTNGSIHWTMERGGEMRLTMLTSLQNQSSRNGWNGPVSAPAITGLDFGRWVFLATTYDSVSGDVSHYRDGRLIGRNQFPQRIPVDLGELEFGNWGADGNSADNSWVLTQTAAMRKRNFVGRLDQLCLLARALKFEEIVHHYEAGRPQ